MLLNVVHTTVSALTEMILWIKPVSLKLLRRVRYVAVTGFTLFWAWICFCRIEKKGRIG